MSDSHFIVDYSERKRKQCWGPTRNAFCAALIHAIAVVVAKTDAALTRCTQPYFEYVSNGVCGSFCRQDAEMRKSLQYFELKGTFMKIFYKSVHHSMRSYWCMHPVPTLSFLDLHETSLREGSEEKPTFNPRKRAIIFKIQSSPMLDKGKLQVR